MALRWAMKNEQLAVFCAVCILGMEARVKVKVCIISHQHLFRLACLAHLNRCFSTHGPFACILVTVLRFGEGASLFPLSSVCAHGPAQIYSAAAASFLPLTSTHRQPLLPPYRRRRTVSRTHSSVRNWCVPHHRSYASSNCH
jgi:hypothetical protein